MKSYSKGEEIKWVHSRGKSWGTVTGKYEGMIGDKVLVSIPKPAFFKAPAGGRLFESRKQIELDQKRIVE